MANFRMLSKAVVSKSTFLKMPLTAQALYFHLNLNADDDGVVEAFGVLRLINGNEDDLKILAVKGFIVILDEELICWINDWQEHNKLRVDRIKVSIYRNLLVEKVPNIRLRRPRQRSDAKGKKSGRSMDGPWTAEVKLREVKLGKVKRESIHALTFQDFQEKQAEILEEARIKFSDKNCEKAMKDFLKRNSAKNYGYDDYKVAYFNWLDEDQFGQYGNGKKKQEIPAQYTEEYQKAINLLEHTRGMHKDEKAEYLEQTGANQLIENLRKVGINVG